MTTFFRLALLLPMFVLAGCPRDPLPTPESTTPRPRTFVQPGEREPSVAPVPAQRDEKPASQTGELANPVSLDSDDSDSAFPESPVASTPAPAPQPAEQPETPPSAQPGEMTDERPIADPVEPSPPSPFDTSPVQPPVSPDFPEPTPLDSTAPEPGPTVSEPVVPAADSGTVELAEPEPAPAESDVSEHTSTVAEPVLDVSEQSEQPESTEIPLPVSDPVSDASDSITTDIVPASPVAEPVQPLENENVIVQAGQFSENMELSKDTGNTGDTEGYDPVAENGEYFVGWPEPKAVLILTGNMEGYVEPCGCAGIARMKGGLSRRHTFIKELEAKKWPVIPIDAGNLIKGFGRQEEIKFEFVINESLRLMNYRAAGIGPRELLFPTDTLVAYTVDAPGSPKRFTSANVALFEFDPVNTAPYRIVTQGDVSVAVTSVLCTSQQVHIHNDYLRLAEPLVKLREILPKIEAEQCDYRVLIVHGDAAEAEAINKALSKKFDFLVLSDTPAEPPRIPLLFPDGAYRIEVGEKGKFAVALGIFDDPVTPIRYQRVALDSRFKNSPDVLAAMECYQDTLRDIGLRGLGIKPVPDPLAPVLGKYVGSQKCADCHENSMRIWKKSGHARAWAGIKENARPARDFDPECIACHAIGWNAQDLFPYESGFLGEKETPALRDVGCESCHGPGEEHVRAEIGSDKDRQTKLRAAVRLAHADAKKTCVTCHDGDNSPEFDFDTYWPKIEHKEEL